MIFTKPQILSPLLNSFLQYVVLAGILLPVARENLNPLLSLEYFLYLLFNGTTVLQYTAIYATS